MLADEIAGARAIEPKAATLAARASTRRRVRSEGIKKFFLD
jgi:hypothetical protein